MKRVTMTHSTSSLPAVPPLKSAFAALALLVAAAAPAMAGPGNLDNPGIAPPQSHFRGRTYSEWSAEWF